MLLFFVALGATALSLQRSEAEDELLTSALKPLEDDFTLLQTVLRDPEKWFANRSLSFLEADPGKPVEKPATGVPEEPKKTSTEEDSVKSLILKVKNVPVSQMPLLLGFMKDMYDRFKKNIARAYKLEEKSKESYKKNLAEKAKWSKSFLKDEGMMNLAKHWDKARELSHRHYHNMLKLSHAGMARLKVAIDMMEQAIAGKKLSKEQMSTLKEMAPEVVFLQLQDIFTFCGTALKELRTPTPEVE